MAVSSRKPWTFKGFVSRMGNLGRGPIATPNRSIGTRSNKPVEHTPVRGYR